MKLSSFKTLLALLCINYCNCFFAQEEPLTIKVKKESNLVKAVFDNTELRLMVIDRFGNPKENRVSSYKLWIKGKGTVKEIDGFSNSLNADMLAALKKQTKATKIFFTEIIVTDDDGHLVKLPDVIDTWFPDCSNCEKGNRRR
jgi:hypothetical protein